MSEIAILRQQPLSFRFADQLDGIESITSILWFVQLAPPPPKLLLPTNRLAPSLIRWC